MKKQVHFNEVAQIGAGQSAPQDPSAFIGKGKPFIRAGSLDDLCKKGFFGSFEQINTLNAKKHKMRLYPAGTIVFAKSGMSATKDRVFILPSPAYIVSHLSTIILNLEECDPSYIRFFWMHYKPSNLIKDEAYPSISAEDIGNVTISLPSLPEQQRIAAILQKADRLRRQRAYTRQLSDSYLNSLFLEMFGDIFTNPYNWEITELGNVISGFEAGVNYPPVTENEKSSEWRVLKVSAVTWGDFNSFESKPISPETKFEQSIIVRKGDLLFSRANTTELVGAVSLVNFQPPKVLLPDKIWRVCFKNPTKILSKYLLHYLQLKQVRKMIGDLASGSSGSMKNISMEKAATIPVMIPPIKLQNEFVCRANCFDSIRIKQIESERQTGQLFQSLLNQAFQGEL